jgi:hypothetical protein
MVPQAFVRLDAIPLLPNGKVDRRALPAPQAAKKPNTPLQRVLAACWAEVLRTRRTHARAVAAPRRSHRKMTVHRSFRDVCLRDNPIYPHAVISI